MTLSSLDGLWWLLLMLGPLLLIQPRLHLEIQAVFLLLTRRPALSIGLFSLLFFPGVLLQGQRVGIPDIDYRHLPDPVAEAIKCLVARIVEMEQELDEIHPERKGKRKEAVRLTQEMLAEFLHFDEGAGI